ncbi:MAG: YhfX family PLP-dependent enzyme [Erysipelotrichaceae bacterium]|nr:YhfX family PLP-dependent enzyme [Erysipelotrichaceae bacterium]
MFLDKVIERNPALVECAFDLHRQGKILPDTYIMDLDAIEGNARKMKEVADLNQVDLYFMLKQIGRNPLIAKRLMDAGLKGAIAVDFKEALRMIEHGVHIANVGHLVQIPQAALKKIIAERPDYVTVYSYEKIREIDETAKKLGLSQKVLIRLSDPDSQLYSGQEGGFASSELRDLIERTEKLSNVKIGGLTVFPALLYSEKEKAILPTANMKALERGIKIAEECGLKDLNINVPSATCCASIPLIHELHGTSGEPGHGLTGTTPLHRDSDEPEIPAYVYVSEISHQFRGRSFCYGGGHYRRGHMENVLVGDDLENARRAKVQAPSDESIDYHYEIDGSFEIGKCAVFAYRTQIFTTRSHVAVVEGLSRNEPKLLGIWSSLGEEISEVW